MWKYCRCRHLNPSASAKCYSGSYQLHQHHHESNHSAPVLVSLLSIKWWKKWNEWENESIASMKWEGLFFWCGDGRWMAEHQRTKSTLIHYITGFSTWQEICHMICSSPASYALCFTFYGGYVLLLAFFTPLRWSTLKHLIILADFFGLCSAIYICILCNALSPQNNMWPILHLNLILPHPRSYPCSVLPLVPHLRSADWGSVAGWWPPPGWWWCCSCP